MLAPGPTSKPRRFPCLRPALKAQYKAGADLEDLQRSQSLVRSTEQRFRGVISYPYKSLNLWFLVESIRLEVPPTARLPSPSAKGPLFDKVVREDLWRQAAIEVGRFPLPTFPAFLARARKPLGRHRL